MGIAHLTITVYFALILMNRDSWIIIYLAYILGLISASLFYLSQNNFSLLIFLKLGIALAVIGFVLRFFIKLDIDNKIYYIAIAIFVLSVLYFNFRLPQPQANDISNLVSSEKYLNATVTGKVLTEPRLNDNYKLKFWLKAQKIAEQNSLNSQQTAGKLYVTVPLLQGKNIYPHEIVTIKGFLYKPQSPKNNIQFNFKKYLREYGSFAGLSGRKIIEQSPTKPWGWYRLRNRIVRAQVKGLGSPLGQLISSMVLGRKAVDLPQDIRDLFIKSGLAHVLAASGFHVSLLLGITLKSTNFLAQKKQLVIGVIVLLIYLGLTGFSPSVIRAVIMGIAVLIAVASKAKVRPLGSLLLAATLILIFNPLWIGDLGFQLSFLSTFGLIVTLPILQNKLDWLPTNIATAIAIPLAASIWVLPLISYAFNMVATYSILINVITTPLITVISLGGMFTSALALLIPSLGSYLTWVLKYPTLLLVAITKFFTSLPGSTFAVGEISLFVLLVIYTLLILTWLNPKVQQKWWLIFITIVALIILPLHYRQQTLLQITILDTSDRPAIVIQDRGETILIDSGNIEDIKYTILPFLASQGISRLDYFATNKQPKSNYAPSLITLQSRLTIKNLAVYNNSDSDIKNRLNIPVQYNPTIKSHSLEIEPAKNSQALQLKISDKQWLIADRLSSPTVTTNSPDVLLWLGKSLSEKTINSFQGKVAIAQRITEGEIENWQSSIDNPQTPAVYDIKKEGTITWTPHTGFVTASNNVKRNNTLW